jgi:hypothetical protein
MDDKLKGAFLRNVKTATGGMGNPGAFDGPLPEYFQGKSDVAANNALLKMLTAGGMGAMAGAVPEASPLLAPGAGLSMLGAAGDLGHMGDMQEGADMWRSTGMPQRPKR